MAETLDDIIDSMPFGRFSCILTLILGVLYMGEASELNLVSIISPHLRCAWNLTSIQTSLMSSAVFIGMGIGNLYWGYLSDKHGRKKFLLLGSFMAVYFGLLSARAPSFIWFVLSRFFVGVGIGSCGFANGYIAEFITMKHRGKTMISMDFFYSFGSIYVAVIALLLMGSSGWRVFLLVATIPPFCFLLLSPWLPESVRYLQNTGDYDHIVKILNRISRCINVPMIHPQACSASLSARGNVKILFSKTYRWKMLIMMVFFISGQCGYYGLVMLNTELLQLGGFCNRNITMTVDKCHDLTKRDYSQNILVVLAELPGALIAALVVDFVGRKSYIIPGFILSAIGFLVLNFKICLTTQSGTALMFIMRLLLMGLSQSAYVVAAELFPTVVRSLALGILMGVSRFGLIAVPFLINYLLHVSLLATTLVFASLCLLTAGLVVMLPETKGRSLINT